MLLQLFALCGLPGSIQPLEDQEETTGGTSTPGGFLLVCNERANGVAVQKLGAPNRTQKITAFEANLTETEVKNLELFLFEEFKAL